MNVINKLKGQVGKQSILGVVIVLFVAVILIANLIPTAITAMFGANTDNWDTGTTAIWDVLPIIIVIALLIVILLVVGLKVTGKI